MPVSPQLRGPPSDWRELETRRRDAAAAADIHDHEEQLAEAQRIANVGSWKFDFVTGRRTYSEQFHRIFGLDPAERPDQERLHSVIHPDDLQRALAMERVAHETLQPVSEELRLVLPDGSQRVITSRARVICDDDSRPLRLVGVVQDITERVANEEELRHVAVQQAAVANLGQIALSGASLEFLFRQVSGFVCSILEVDDCQVVRGESAIAGALTVPIASADEGPWGALAVQSPEGKPLSTTDADFLRSVAMVLSQAIEHSRADAELRARARQQSAIAELGRIALTKLDRETIERACDLVKLGLEVEEAVFVEGDDVILSRPSSLSLLRTGSDGEGSRHTEILRCAQDDGIRAPVASATRTFGILGALAQRARPFTAADVDYVQSLANILAVGMEREAAEREQRKLELKLEQAIRLSALGRLAATVAHEFNNVLMGISPFVEVIRRKPERTAGALDHIASAVARGKRITEEILRFTRPAELVRTTFSVALWLDEIAAQMHSTIRVDVDLDDPLLTMHGDRNQLHQVLTNLIVNAHHAMPDGGTITVTVRREQHFVHFSVADTGFGMSEETLQHIFEPLFTTKGSGTGLGLAVAHQVVELHGGEIYAESVAGAGSTFHILIPIADGGGTLPSLAPAPQGPRPSPAQHVLLVDDDETVVAGLVTLLELEGLHVDVVSTGAAAIDYVRRRKPDVVVLDVGLPDIDGMEVYAQLAAIHKELPVVFSTGHADSAQLRELLACRHVTSLLKPYDLTTLLEAIERAMHR